MTENKTPKSLTVAAVQMNSQESIDDNLDSAYKCIESMASTPNLIVLPELFNYRSKKLKKAAYNESIEAQTISWLTLMAVQYNAMIIGGSMIELNNNQAFYNTSIVINASGDIVGKYRKIHLFDVDIGNKKIMESNLFNAGNRPLIVSIGQWRIGVSICYDLRFPELYRWYFKQGVDAVVIPSSFTTKTGTMHWHTLCRARAIENQMYVIAPNQTGIGAGNESTYGHSLIVDPYGRIMSEMNGEDTGTITAELNREILNELRENVPIASHIKSQLFT